MAVIAGVSFGAENWASGVVFGAFGLFGAWSVATFPMGFSVDDRGIEIRYPIGSRLFRWRQISRVTRMPGPFRLGENSRGRRGITRESGTLMLVVGLRRISISSVREPVALRDELIATARNHGVEVMPAVNGSEWAR
jgi:hypothetical protein